MTRQRLTKEESGLLLSIITKHQDVLDTKSGSGGTKAMRDEIWNKVEREFNGHFGSQKLTVKRLKKWWEYHRMKQKKVAFDVGLESRRLRNGPLVIPEDETTQQSVISVFSTASTGAEDHGTPENINTTPSTNERTANLSNCASEDIPTTPMGRPAPGSVRFIAEQEMSARLNRLEALKVKEVGILALREEEATLARAVKEKELVIKEQELSNAKEVHDIQLKQMIEEGELRRRILEAELKLKEAQLRQMMAAAFKNAKYEIQLNYDWADNSNTDFNGYYDGILDAYSDQKKPSMTSGRTTIGKQSQMVILKNNDRDLRWNYDMAGKSNDHFECYYDLTRA
ncbi:myb/SANT-like DNA-binding domain-containing protein 3 [Hetaerina americana]|uniref:myb/SANT-like DNA-binding domain-containing protein 3 n=1 Tax=Hetaerina americana TaxID=62018 RepID=UPI003A7F332E